MVLIFGTKKVLYIKGLKMKFDNIDFFFKQNINYILKLFKNFFVNIYITKIVDKNGSKKFRNIFCKYCNYSTSRKKSI